MGGKGGAAAQPQIIQPPPPQLSPAASALQDALSGAVIKNIGAYQPFFGQTAASQFPSQGWGQITPTPGQQPQGGGQMAQNGPGMMTPFGGGHPMPSGFFGGPNPLAQHPPPYGSAQNIAGALNGFAPTPVSGYGSSGYNSLGGFNLGQGGYNQLPFGPTGFLGGAYMGNQPQQGQQPMAQHPPPREGGASYGGLS